jgi:hypothetical protein
MKRNKTTKHVQSARKKLVNSNAYLDVLDAALASAEEELKTLLPMLKPSEVSEAFATHIHTHLSTELSNIAAHGHRNDDPEAPPQAKPDVLAALKQAASVLDLWLNGPGDADGKETDAALMVANAAILSKQKKGGFNISITKREHATILAALRLWQEADEHNRGYLRDIAEAAGVSLSNKEIDVLCTRINLTSNRGA